jgi:hypothetical protein
MQPKPIAPKPAPMTISLVPPPMSKSTMVSSPIKIAPAPSPGTTGLLTTQRMVQIVPAAATVKKTMGPVLKLPNSTGNKEVVPTPTVPVPAPLVVAAPKAVLPTPAAPAAPAAGRGRGRGRGKATAPAPSVPPKSPSKQTAPAGLFKKYFQFEYQIDLIFTFIFYFCYYFLQNI